MSRRAPMALPVGWARICLAAALSLGVLAAPAAAAATPLEALDLVRNYALPPGPLSDGLGRVAADAGLLLSVDARLVAGLRHGGLQGRHTPREAFDRLLAGSGLRLVQHGPGLSLQSDGAGAQAPRRDLTLPPVQVHGQGSDDGGYLAESSLSHPDIPLQQLTESVTVLSADLLRDQAPRSVADALRQVPGLGAAQGEGNRDTPVFRGHMSTADFLLDGLRDDVQYYRDFYNVEQMEVLRGPAALTVGHGAAAGLISRVTKQPTWRNRGELSLEAGRWDQHRVALDVDRRLSDDLAARLNVMAESAGSYRDHLRLDRSGVHPVLAWRAGPRTTLTLGLEHFQDKRTADRGIPSYQGRPLDVEPGRFFGNADQSLTWIYLDAMDLRLDTVLGDGLALQHHSRYARYDKFFQNVFPGSVRAGADGLEVALLAHNSRIHRENLLHQTELTGRWQHGAVEHRWTGGVEIGHQQGDNRRETGFFSATDPNATTLWVPLSQADSQVPVTFRARSTDPDNAMQARSAAGYLQDQVRLSPRWQLTFGLRHDFVRLSVQDHALGQSLGTTDRLWSPRFGVAYLPRPSVTLYLSHSIGHALRAGEQYNVLSAASQLLPPERFNNHEVGVKWQPNAALALAAALYQMDREHVAVPDPAAPTTALLLVDGQRTRGLELSASGRFQPGWDGTASYALQDSRVRQSMSSSALAGAWMPHVPRQQVSLWNRWTLSPQWAVGLGLLARSGLYTSTDNTVRLPGFARIDTGLFYAPDPRWRLQLNIENLFDRRYYAFAHSNSNITPASPRMLRLGLRAGF